MSAKVYGSDSNTFEHDSGTVLEVKEGHLLVRSGNQGDIVAVYAPTHWTRAETHR